MSAYDRAIELKPDFADAWLSKGDSFGILGKDQDAIHCFEKFIECATPENASRIEEIQEIIDQMKN